MRALKFQKMWETANTYVFDVDVTDIIAILQYQVKVSAFADKHWLFYYSDGVGAGYHEEGEMARAEQNGLREFLDPAYRSRYFEGIASVIHDMALWTKKAEREDFSVMNPHELRDLLAQGTEIIARTFGYYGTCQPQCVAGIEVLAQSNLESYVPAEEAQEVYMLLSTPDEDSTLRKEEIDWQTLVFGVKSRSISAQEMQEALTGHWSKYRLLVSADGHRSSTLEDYAAKLEEDLKGDPGDIEERLYQLTHTGEVLRKKKQEVIAKYSIPPSVTDYCMILGQIGHARLELRVGWMAAFYYIQPLVEEIGRRFSITAERIRFATSAEVAGLFDGNSIDPQLLEERAKAFLFEISDGVSTLWAGDDAAKRFQELVAAQNLQNIEQVKGSVAMRGKVTGKVVVFNWGDNIERKLKQFEGPTVLVAGQTRPQLMSLINKSAAIVTDEGGITSHAAIVSRELKIPCVIGTKMATKVFKDGDIVEVDALTGLVRLIKRS